MGILVDRVHVTTVILITTAGSVFAVFVLWGLSSKGDVLLLMFSAVYGFFAGSYSCTNAGVVKELRGREGHDEGRSVDAGLVLGLLGAGRGVGSVVAGPVSEALLDTGANWEANGGYGSGYGPLIVFTGVGVTLGGCGWGAKRVGWI